MARTGLIVPSTFETCAKLISFTAPYVVIEGAYLVREDSPIRDIAEVDHPGIRVAVSTGSAYDLFLSRELRHKPLHAELPEQERERLDGIMARKPARVASSAPAPTSPRRRCPCCTDGE